MCRQQAKYWNNIYNKDSRLKKLKIFNVLLVPLIDGERLFSI